jgi:hypothetical protein
LFKFVFLCAGIQAENGRYGEYSHQKIMQKSGKSSSILYSHSHLCVTFKPNAGAFSRTVAKYLQTKGVCQAHM